MRAFDAPAEDIEAVEAALQATVPSQPEDATFPVYHDNWLIAQVFERCSTQWQRAGMAGVRAGLCYAGVEVVLKHFVPKKKRAEVLDGLQLMERAVLVYDALNRPTKID